MANRYQIDKILSVGKRGKMMVSVHLGNKSVTRHLINGQGRHPDDAIPALHERHAKRVNALRESGRLMRCEHTPSPAGTGDYFAWYAFAERMSKTHRQVRCPRCGLWAIWEPKPPSKAAVRATIQRMERDCAKTPKSI